MGIEISDIVGLSKPLTRLVEVISKGVGAVSQPYLIRKKADAKAYEVHTIASALKEVADKYHLPVVFKGGEVDVWQKPEDGTLVLNHDLPVIRSNRRVDYQQRKCQHNIESITAAAAEELAGESDVSSELPDEDWISRFFRTAEDVSSTQMQELWGRILAGEIKKPRSYSLKTLDFVRNLTKDDADMLERLSKLAVSYEGWPFIPCHNDKWLADKRKIYHSHYFAAGELGAMYPTDLIYRTFRSSEINQETFIAGNILLIVDRAKITSEIELPVWKFTNIGKEILQLIKIDGDLDQIIELGRFYVRQRAVVKVADIIERLPNGLINYTNVREIHHPGKNV